MELEFMKLKVTIKNFQKFSMKFKLMELEYYGKLEYIKSGRFLYIFEIMVD